MQQPIEDETADAKLTWRRLEFGDVQALVSIAATIHPGLPESAEVFAERVELFPQGCLALVDNKSANLYGYAISHPIQFRQPPVLDSLLGQIPHNSDQYYIHDVAILPEHQGKGYSNTCIEWLMGLANGYMTTGLISVYGTAPFWQKHGFQHIERNDEVAAKVRDYGKGAAFLEHRNQMANKSA